MIGGCLHKQNNHKFDESVVSSHSVRLFVQLNWSFMLAKLNLVIWSGWHDWQIHLAKQPDWVTRCHWLINFMIALFMKTIISHTVCPFVHIMYLLLSCTMCDFNDFGSFFGRDIWSCQHYFTMFYVKIYSYS